MADAVGGSSRTPGVLPEGGRLPVVPVVHTGPMCVSPEGRVPRTPGVTGWLPAGPFDGDVARLPARPEAGIPGQTEQAPRSAGCGSTRCLGVSPGKASWGGGGGARASVVPSRELPALVRVARDSGALPVEQGHMPGLVGGRKPEFEVDPGVRGA